MSSIPVEQATSPRSLKSETAPEYIRRILGFVEGKDARTVLETTAGRLRQIVEQSSAADLQRQPAPGRWSPVQVIEHLADSEIVFSYRIRSVLGHDGISIQAFDQDEWASNLAYERADPSAAVELFAAARAANLRLLDRVDPRLHDNYGMHSERGKETISHMIRLYAGHDLNHLGQLE